jgi:hypothetical protein
MLSKERERCLNTQAERPKANIASFIFKFGEKQNPKFDTSLPEGNDVLETGSV